jgi:pilus assembly protein CpaC
MRSPAFFTALCTTAIFCVATAQAAPRSINMEEGQQRTWAQARPVTRAATANEAIVGINVIPPRGVIITAKKAGSAMVSVWDGNATEPSMQFQVVVSPSAHVARQSLGNDSQAQIANDGAKLRLSGGLSSLEKHATLASALDASTNGEAGGGSGSSPSKFVDASTSNFDVQVQIDIKIVEVSRQKLKEAGFYMNRNSTNARFGISGPGNLTSFEQSKSTDYVKMLNSGAGFIPRGDAFNIFRWTDNNLAIFSALENNGFAYTLAEPSLTAMSGQTATFLAGGEIPIPLRSGSGSDSSVSVSFKEFGIRLGLAPTVLDQNRIALRVSPEVSEIDESLSVTTGGFSIPGLRVRRTETTVAVGDGETFVISGLVSRSMASSVDKFPFLGDLPILGMFFRSTRFDKEDRELLMLATPHLVRPFAKGTKLPNLPGEEVRKYDPGALYLMLLESGRFDQQDSGFSN